MSIGFRVYLERKAYFLNLCLFDNFSSHVKTATNMLKLTFGGVVFPLFVHVMLLSHVIIIGSSVC